MKNICKTLAFLVLFIFISRVNAAPVTFTFLATIDSVGGYSNLAATNYECSSYGLCVGSSFTLTYSIDVATHRYVTSYGGSGGFYYIAFESDGEALGVVGLEIPEKLSSYASINNSNTNRNAIHGSGQEKSSTGEVSGYGITITKSNSVIDQYFGPNANMYPQFIEDSYVKNWRPSDFLNLRTSRYVSGLGRSELNGHAVLLSRSDVVSTVPVPAAAWLMGSGLIGLVALKRTRN